MKKYIVIASVLFSLKAGSQIKDFPYTSVISAKMPATIINGDTVAIVRLDELMVVADRNFTNYEDALKYFTLKQNVKLVYPYAILVQATFDQCEETVKNMTSEKEKKQYLKQMEKQLTKQYSDELKSLTQSQGRLLIKLIDRQTGNTSYAMVKELKGSFCAFMWQAVACLFGNSMKAKYDPEGDDKEVEHIIRLIEAGVI